MPEVFVGKKEQREELVDTVYETLLATLNTVKEAIEGGMTVDANLTSLIAELRYAYEGLTREYVDYTDSE